MTRGRAFATNRPRGYPALVHYYVPPRFELFEFDERPLSLSPQDSRRWFSGWNGPVGAPAREVTLAWSAGRATVLVATADWDGPAELTRLSAAHLALGGDALPVPSRPVSTGAVMREIERISASDELWAVGPALAPDGPPSQVAAGDGFWLAYAPAGAETVLVAAVGASPGQLSVRKATDWEAYDLDATRAHELGELNRGGSAG